MTTRGEILATNDVEIKSAEDVLNVTQEIVNKVRKGEIEVCRARVLHSYLNSASRLIGKSVKEEKKDREVDAAMRDIFDPRFR